jgi:DNA-binding XRE family transcriptional regulator
VYTYAHGGDHRLVVESAMLGGDPPLVHVRAWLGDWARYMDTPVQESTTDDLPTLTLTGLVGDQPVVVRAIPAALPHPRANRVHPVVRRLRGMREARGWTADHTARLLGYDTNTLWRWEHGETVPRVDQLADYAQAFGLDLALTPAGGRR